MYSTEGLLIVSVGPLHGQTLSQLGLESGEVCLSISHVEKARQLFIPGKSMWSGCVYTYPRYQWELLSSVTFSGHHNRWMPRKTQRVVESERNRDTTLTKYTIY